MRGQLAPGRCMRPGGPQLKDCPLQAGDAAAVSVEPAIGIAAFDASEVVLSDLA